MNRPNPPANVARIFDNFPQDASDSMLAVRALIFQTATTNPAIGPLTETLKWGQPAYLTQHSKSGTTIRLGVQDGRVAVFFHCQTMLIEAMREIYPDTFGFQGNRALLITAGQPLPNDALAHCIEMALTYHLNKTRA